MNSNRVQNLFKSRINIVEMLANIGYIMDGYDKFTVAEVEAMYLQSQMDMLIKHATNNTSIYVRYHIHDKPSAKLPKIDDLIHQVFEVEKHLTKNDTLMIIVDDDPNDSLRLKQQKWFERDGRFLVIHSLVRLQFNIFKHQLSPLVSKLTEEETQTFMKDYFVMEKEQLPEISRFDPLALALCLRPGEVCRLERNSPTSMTSTYYRLCV